MMLLGFLISGLLAWWQLLAASIPNMGASICGHGGYSHRGLVIMFRQGCQNLRGSEAIDGSKGRYI